MGQVSYQETFGPIPLSVPPIDLVTYIFDPQRDYDKTKKLYFDADDDTQALSAEEVQINVKKLIAGFKAAGVKNGDTVVLHLFNTYLYTCLFLAAIGSGAKFTGTNPSYKVFELAHRFRLCPPTVIITAPEHLANVQAALKEAEIPDSKIFVLDSAAKTALTSSLNNGFTIPTRNGKHELTNGPAAHMQNGELDLSNGTSARTHNDKHNTSNGFTIRAQNETEELSNGSVIPSRNRKHEIGDVPSVAELLDHGSSDWRRISDIKTAKETIAVMFSTSGTTGLPKVSQLSHYALITHNLGIQSEGKNYQTRRLMSLPFFNMFASGIVHIEPLRWGEPCYVMSRFETTKYVLNIHKYSITDTCTAPLMLVYMLKSGLPLKEKLASLRYIYNGSAPVDAETLTQFFEVLSPEAMIAAIWGMSETGAQTVFKWFERDASGSVGRICPGVEMKLIDENGQHVTQDNVHGEVWVRSPGLMTSYAKNPKATAEMIHGEWLRTGDICYVSEGKWFVVDRKKELIKVRGWQVAPAELEGVLVSHPKILDSAVVGVKYKDSEAPRAFVLRAPGVTENDLTEGDVHAFMNERLSNFKTLKGGVIFVDAIPKNMTGKTVKRILTEKYPYIEA